ncbi:MAG TPA: sigma-54 dependent transcriptional regulator [Vicinamibacteria bacterium]|nr:sigma-54 dependent transcriptional regulator [Vicinamibacteria bacterium]
MKSILVIDDNRLIRQTFKSHLTSEGFDVDLAADGIEGVDAFKRIEPDLVILDIHLPGIQGIEVLKQIREIDPKAYVIMITAFDDMKTTVEAMKRGAFEYICKPIDYDELILSIRKAQRMREMDTKLDYLVTEASQTWSMDNIVGRTQQMREVFKTIGMLSRSTTTVLVRGESGTGKELVARAIHYNSINRDEPFVAVNCTALAEGVLESELFGHVRGAFTGAVRDSRGKIEIAQKGTLFLDEIGDVSPNLQAKLLRVVENREFSRVGGERLQRTDARIVGATNRDLEELVRLGKFREDLYYRLKVVEIRLPPLRERREDIPDLVAYLLEKVNRHLHTNVRKVPESVMESLTNYDWKGNVRELENALTRAVTLAHGDVLLAEHLPLVSRDGMEQGFVSDELTSLKDMERQYIARVLRHTRWNKSRASEILGITRPTLDKKIRDYSLVDPRKHQDGAGDEEQGLRSMG